MGDLQLARSTGLRTSRAVVMSVTTDEPACQLGANTNDWRQGWVVLSELDGNNALNNNEPVIVQRGPLIGLQLIQTDGTAGRIALRSNGLLNSGNAPCRFSPTGRTGNRPRESESTPQAGPTTTKWLSRPSPKRSPCGLPVWA